MAVVVAASAALVLAACGSQVPPSKFINAQAGLGGYAQGNNGNSGGGGGPAAPNGASTGTVAGSTPTAGSSLGPGGSGGSGGGGGGGSAAGNNNPAAGIHAGSCAGFANQTGINGSTITLANVADVSGPVSGLFQGVQQAMKAFVAYFNSTTTICGRKLALESLDSQTSSGGDQQAATTACGNAFAMVGSMGAFDAGGAQTVTQCGIPDLRTASTETDRATSPVVYGVQSLNPLYEPTAPANFYKSAYPGVAAKAGFVYLDA